MSSYRRNTCGRGVHCHLEFYNLRNTRSNLGISQQQVHGLRGLIQPLKALNFSGGGLDFNGRLI